MVRHKTLPLKSMAPDNSSGVAVDQKYVTPSMLFFAADQDDEMSSEDVSNEEDLMLPEIPFVHPLSSHPEIKLNAIQVLITAAIANSGFSATLTSITNYINKHFKRNGYPEGVDKEMDTKTLVRYNIASVSKYQPALFKKESQRGRSDRHLYKLVFTFDDSLSVMRSLNESYVKKQNEAAVAAKRKSEQARAATNKAQSKKSGSNKQSNKRLRSGRSTSSSASASASSTVEPEVLEDVQILAFQALKSAGGNAPLYEVIDYIKQNIDRVRLAKGRDAQNSFYEILPALLEDEECNLVRDPTNVNHWRVRAGASIPAVARAVPEQSGSSSSTSSGSRRTTRQARGKRERAPPKLTQLQVEMARIIHNSGGSASFQTMHEEILKIFDRLRRRDGSQYTADAGRAIKASLANSTSANPIFSAVDSEGTKVWSNTERAEAALAQAGPMAEPMDVEEEEEEDDDEAYEDPSATRSSRRQRSARRKARSESVAATGDSDTPAAAAPTKKSKKGFSAMQAVLCKVLTVHGGTANLELIMSEVERNWHLLKRKDGSAYSSDTARAVKACLGNTSAPVPLFCKDAENEGMWIIQNEITLQKVLDVWDTQYTGFVFDGPKTKGEEQEGEGEKMDEDEGDASPDDTKVEPGTDDAAGADEPQEVPSTVKEADDDEGDDEGVKPMDVDNENDE